jgi:hypothetical protein
MNRAMIKTALLSFACFAPVFAQPVSFGVEGGVPITDAFDTFKGNTASYATDTHRYLVGPAFQIHLPLRLTFEVDALYKRLGYQYNASTATTRTTAATVANSWEFPLLIKYEILPGPIRPFVDAGISFRHITGVKEIRQVINTTTGAIGVTTLTNPESSTKTPMGPWSSVRVAFKMGPARIGPEIRYAALGKENLKTLGLTSSH